MNIMLEAPSKVIGTRCRGVVIFQNLIFERESNSKTTAKNPKTIFHFVLEIFGK